MSSWLSGGSRWSKSFWIFSFACWCTASGISRRNSSKRARSTLRHARISEAVFSLIQIAPGTYPMDADGNQGTQGHCRILRVALPETFAAALESFAGFENGGLPADHHPAEPGPVLVVMVGDEGRVGISLEIADAPRTTRALGLVVERRVQHIGIKGKADRNHARYSAGIGGGKMAYFTPQQECGFTFGEHHRRRFCFAIPTHSRSLRRV